MIGSLGSILAVLGRGTSPRGEKMGEARGPILRTWRRFWTHFGPFSSIWGQIAYLRLEHCDIAAADIRPVSTADICPVSTENIYPVSTADVSGGDGNDFDPFFTPKMFKMEFIWGCPAVPGGAPRNGGRAVETEPHQPRMMARITAVKQTPSNQ